MSGAPDLIALYGTAVPPAEARVLSAGPFSARLEAGNLRYLRFGDTEILRAVAFVVRDRDWGTYAPEISGLEVSEGLDEFLVTYAAVCRGPAVLRYRARIEGRADGTLRFDAEAVAEGDFETNRCGFVVLHPAAAAGAAASIEHCDGSREETVFPELIDPWRPFVAIREITHRAGRLDVTCRLEGDAFEMEDQRNWSDASFKTYGRPLEMPWPFVLPAGTPVVQSVSVSVRARFAGREGSDRSRCCGSGSGHDTTGSDALQDRTDPGWLTPSSRDRRTVRAAKRSSGASSRTRFSSGCRS